MTPPPEFHAAAFAKLADQTIPRNARRNLARDLACDVLDELHPHLDLVARKASDHIDPLHVHIVKGRAITVFEHARLHLVWDARRVFLKPIPACLFSETFWTENLQEGNAAGDDDELRRQVLGFLRTYTHLIASATDFAIAQREHLLPAAAAASSLQYSDFDSFIDPFRNVDDAQVAKRYEFGQLRLGRLDWAVRLLQPRPARDWGTDGGSKNDSKNDSNSGSGSGGSNTNTNTTTTTTTNKRRGGMLRRFYYEEPFYQLRQFLNDFGVQLAAVAAVLSLILSAMQVALAGKSSGSGWPAFAETSARFSIAVIVFLVASVVAMGLISSVVVVLQLGYGLRMRRVKKKEEEAKRSKV